MNITTLEELQDLLRKYNASVDTNMRYVLVQANEEQALQEDRNTLLALQAAGVDNWSGYADAFDELSE
jgi:hypothetical protein